MGRRKVDAAVDLIAEIQGKTGLSSQKISRAMDALRAEGKPLTAENIFAHAGGNPSLLGPSKEYIPPPEAPQPGMERIQRTPLEERLSVDPVFRQGIEEFSPGFARRMDKGGVTPDEVMDMYGTGPLSPVARPPVPDAMPRMPAQGGAMPLGGRVDEVLRRLQGGPPRPQQSIANQFDAAFQADLMPARPSQPTISDIPYGERAAMNPPRAALEDPMEAFRARFESEGDRLAAQLADDVRFTEGMGQRQPVAPADGGTSPGWTGGTEYREGISDDFLRRMVAEAPRDGVLADFESSGFRLRPILPGVAAGAALGGAMSYLKDNVDQIPEPLRDPVGWARRNADRLPEALRDPLGWADRNMRSALQPQAEELPMDAGPEVMPDEPDALGADDPMATADLAAESRPLPDVAVEEAPAPVDPSLQARQLIDELNARRRAAGGEVPDAPQVMAEVNRLMEMGNQTRRATYVAAPQDDAGKYFQQAQGMIDQVNQMYRQGMTPNSPEVRQMMAEVRRLQQMGDSLRNRRAG